MIITSFWSGNTELPSRSTEFHSRSTELHSLSTQGLYREDTLGQCSDRVTNFAFLGAIFIPRLVYIDLW